MKKQKQKNPTQQKMNNSQESLKNLKIYPWRSNLASLAEILVSNEIHYTQSHIPKESPFSLRLSSDL